MHTPLTDRLIAEALARTSSGVSHRELERRLGLSNNALKGLLDKKAPRTPGVDKAKEIAEAFGWEFYMGPSEDRRPNSELLIDKSRFATVPRYDASAAAGGGVFNLDQEPIDHLAFSSEWLAREGISPRSCALITAKGESMRPTIYDGDLIMFDRRRTAIRSGRVYVFNDPTGGTLVKRLEVIEATAIIARSDNHEHEPLHYLGTDMNTVAVGVLGQVIWSGHRWK